MSKALSEDSEGKRASANEYGTRQLFRRPSPVSNAGRFAWVRIGQYSRTVPDSTVVPLASKLLWYDPTLVTEDVDFSWDQEDVGETDNSWIVRSRVPGWYQWDVLLNIGIGGALTNDAGTITIWLSEDPLDGDLGEYMEAWDVFDAGTFTAGSQGEGADYVHGSGLVHVTSTNRSWHWKVAQTTGGALDFGVVYITVMRMMADDSATWTMLTADPS